MQEPWPLPLTCQDKLKSPQPTVTHVRVALVPRTSEGSCPALPQPREAPTPPLLGCSCRIAEHCWRLDGCSEPLPTVLYCGSPPLSPSLSCWDLRSFLKPFPLLGPHLG